MGKDERKVTFDEARKGAWQPYSKFFLSVFICLLLVLTLIGGVVLIWLSIPKIRQFLILNNLLCVICEIWAIIYQSLYYHHIKNEYINNGFVTVPRKKSIKLWFYTFFVPVLFAALVMASELAKLFFVETTNVSGFRQCEICGIWCVFITANFMVNGYLETVTGKLTVNR